jgi:ACS family hexuronate transporter-like MFS transporter
VELGRYWPRLCQQHLRLQRGAGFLGVTEAGNFPAAIKTTAEWFPQRERALATGIFNSGSNVGAIIAPLTVPLIAETIGWKWAFIITGALGFVWLLLVVYLLRSARPASSPDKAEFDYIHSDVDDMAGRFDYDRA